MFRVDGDFRAGLEHLSRNAQDVADVHLLERRVRFSPIVPPHIRLTSP